MTASDIATAYQHYAEGLKRANTQNKTAVFDALSALGITHVSVDFDGEGDSGQINNIAAYKGEALTELPEKNLTIQSVTWGNSAMTAVTKTLFRGIEELCYDLLSDGHE